MHTAEISHAADIAALKLLSICDEIGRESQKPLSGLIIETHRTDNRRTLSDICLEKIMHKDGYIDHVHGKTDMIQNHVDGMRNYIYYEAILATFELHHFLGEEREKLLRTLRDLMPCGTFVLADYTYKGLDESLCREMTQSKDERNQIIRYGGFEEWWASHNQDTLKSLEECVSTGRFRWQASKLLSLGRGIVIGSDTFDPSKMVSMQ